MGLGGWGGRLCQVIFSALIRVGPSGREVRLVWKEVGWGEPSVVDTWVEKGRLGTRGPVGTGTGESTLASSAGDVSTSLGKALCTPTPSFEVVPEASLPARERVHTRAPPDAAGSKQGCLA